MQTIEKLIEESVNTQCENQYFYYINQLELLHQNLILPEGLSEKIISLAKQQKYLFYRGFREKVHSNILQVLKDNELKMKFKINKNESLSLEPSKSFDEIKNRIWLETYLQCNENARAAANYLKVPKSTFHDWLKKHEELIFSEKNKSKAVENANH